MSHHLESLSPLLKIKSKNRQVVFDEQLPLIKRASHPDLQRISSETVDDVCFWNKNTKFFFL